MKAVTRVLFVPAWSEVQASDVAARLLADVGYEGLEIEFSVTAADQCFVTDEGVPAWFLAPRGLRRKQLRRQLFTAAVDLRRQIARAQTDVLVAHGVACVVAALLVRPQSRGAAALSRFVAEDERRYLDAYWRHVRSAVW